MTVLIKETLNLVSLGSGASGLWIQLVSNLRKDKKMFLLKGCWRILTVRNLLLFKKTTTKVEFYLFTLERENWRIRTITWPNLLFP